MTNKAKKKGYDGEVEFAAEIGGARVPLSGSIPSMPGDVQDSGEFLHRGAIWSVKRTKQSDSKVRSPVERVAVGIEKLLEGFHGLAIRRDRRPWLVAMELQAFQDAVRRAYQRGRDDERDLVEEEKELDDEPDPPFVGGF